MDAAYWKTRCEAAERALERARTAVRRQGVREPVIAALGDLKPGEYLSTGELARRLHWPEHRALYVLDGMWRVGLVDRTPEARCGGRGNSVRWKLGHLVQVEVQMGAELAE